jgi:predicted site-specific integrase-resolvase
MDMKVSSSKAAKEMGVAIGTFQRREAVGKIEEEGVPRGHLRYNLAKLKCSRPRILSLPLFASVSSHYQKSYLGNPSSALGIIMRGSWLAI